MSAAPDEPEYLTTKQVAERVGIKHTSVRQELWRRHMPEPDLVLLGHPLWMPETIDEWRADRYKPRKKRRRGKRRARRSVNVPPKKVPLSAVGAPSDFRPVAGVTEEIAKEVAAALRGEGHHCTALDVAELAASDPARLGYDRRKLRERVMRKVRGLRS